MELIPPPSATYGYRTEPTVRAPHRQGASRDAQQLGELSGFQPLLRALGGGGHELTHSTGHETLLNRKTLVDMNAFGDENYSKEELVAEVGAQFLTGIVGLQPKSDETNSQAYINGWIAKIGNDKKFLVSACTQAMTAVDCILGN